VFPEGTWYLQNDRLGPLREGVAVITRRAAQQSRRPLVILPVALKYWLLEDARPVLARRLARLEARITGSSLDHLPLVPRIEALTDGLLAREEAGHMGQALTGPIDRRRLDLADAIVSGLEASCGGAPQAGSLMERVLRLRRLLVPRLVEAAPRPQECAAIQRQLQHLLLCQGLFGHSHAYLCEQPGLERLSEAVQRLEEIVTGEPEQPVAPLGAVVEVGAPLPVRERLGAGRGERKAGARLVEEVAGRTQAMLDGLLAEGPPAAWHCPPRDAVMAQEARALVAPEPPSAVR